MNLDTIDLAWLTAWSQPLMRTGQVILILALAWLAKRILTLSLIHI